MPFNNRVESNSNFVKAHYNENFSFKSEEKYKNTNILIPKKVRTNLNNNIKVIESNNTKDNALKYNSKSFGEVAFQLPNVNKTAVVNDFKKTDSIFNSNKSSSIQLNSTVTHNSSCNNTNNDSSNVIEIIEEPSTSKSNEENKKKSVETSEEVVDVPITTEMSKNALNNVSIKI